MNKWGLKVSGLCCGMLLGVLSACSGSQPQAIDPQLLLQHIKVLSSDEFAGRLPGTLGETKTVAYLTEQFKQLGLAPGNPDGSYVQDVPLMGIKGKPNLNISVAGKPFPVQFRQDYVATTARFEPEVTIQTAPLVFVGYGVQAPEYNWDDYKDVDVRGKILLMLINDPAIPDSQQPTQLDARMFKGKAMTYYGRWTYKYEIAEKLGAAGVLIVHETKPAGYGWNVVESSWTGEAFELADAGQSQDNLRLRGWLSLEKTQALLTQAGQDFARLKAAAMRADFKPVELNVQLSSRIHNELRAVKSQNVVARLPGNDVTHANEYVVYTAHWDHLGVDQSLTGDQIHNGAVDNASGVAGLLEIARSFTTGKIKPQRSVLFMAVTAEEQGLLGSKYYAEHPLYPLNKTLADINMDSINVWGATRDVQVIGFGQNTLEDTYATLVKARKRTVVADSEPEKGRYFRSDQFSFAKQGVPSLYIKSGIDFTGKPVGWGQAKLDEYTQHDYHAPSDEIKAEWNLGGAAEDMQLLYQLGLTVATANSWPTWKADSEFRQVRAASLAAQ